MSPVVRVVGIHDGRGRTDATGGISSAEDQIRRRAEVLPDGVDVAIVPTRGGLLITLSSGYGRRPGARRRAIRRLETELVRMLQG
jgi:hypothetical protein